MRFSTSIAAAAVAISLPFAVAQTSTDCNPLDKTCPKDAGLTTSSFTSDFTKGSSAMKSWSSAGGTALTFGKNGAQFSIAQAGQAPTIQTDFYVFFGKFEVKMRAAPGAGIVSSIVLLSDDLDEIDWEWVGGDTSHVQTNFFGKGNTTVYDRGETLPVSRPQNTFHTYGIDWNSDRIIWSIDGKTVRTLKRTDPLTIGGSQYPQTPMRLKLGSWCGGCSGNSAGTISWAGGPTTFGSTPYNMYVESVSITNYNPATSYTWTGHSGSWQSIKVNKASKKSPTKRGLSAPPAAASSNPLASLEAGSSSSVVASASASANPLSSLVSVSSNAPFGTGAPRVGNSTAKSTGTGRIIKTSTRMFTAHATPTNAPGASAAAKPGSNSGTTVSIVSSTALFGVLFAFFLL